MNRVISSSRSFWRSRPLRVGMTVSSRYQFPNLVACLQNQPMTSTGGRPLITRKWFSDSKTPQQPTEDESIFDEEIHKVRHHPASDLKFDRAVYTLPVTIRMPDISDTNDNRVEEWFKKPGDVIKHDDVLCDITTPDFTFGMSIDDETDAIMGEILVEAGIHVADGTPICVVYHPEETKPIQDTKESEK